MTWFFSPSYKRIFIKEKSLTHLGGMFSGLLDQSDTQSALFFKTSNSFSPSTASSSDWKYTWDKPYNTQLAPPYGVKSRATTTVAKWYAPNGGSW